MSRPDLLPIQAPPHREPYVWLLISIPAAAVLAGLITLALAIASADTAAPTLRQRKAPRHRDWLRFVAADTG